MVWPDPYLVPSLRNPRIVVQSADPCFEQRNPWIVTDPWFVHNIYIHYFIVACLQMISTERVLAYSRLKPEAPLETKPMSSKPPPDWPNKGHIELSNVEYRHSCTSPLVLKDISLTIMASEKVYMSLYMHII